MAKERKTLNYIDIQIKKIANESFIIPLIYIDDIRSFDSKILNWAFDKNDKRKIKRIKKKKKI